MKKDGFTLVELLAVIVILGVLALIITISTRTTINNSKTKLSQIQIQKVEESAKIYYLNEGVNEAFYDIDESKTCVNVSYLIENDYLEENEIKDPKDNSNILGSVKIIYKNKKYKYEYQNTECNHSDYFVSVDAVCDLVSDVDSSDSVTPGDKYQCKVKEKMEAGFEDGYYFYVLSYNDKEGNITEDIEEAETLNLIMERNMYYDSTNDIGMVATSSNSNVAWYSTISSHQYGPVTAMTYLHNATKDWDNIPNMIMNYEDENIDYNTQQKGTNGYGSIVTTGTTTIITSKTNEETGRIENLKARMPRYDEVHGTGKCLTYAENGNQYGSCPLWLSNYLSSSSYVTGEGLQNISGIYGYWTFSSDASHSDFAWLVSYYGNVGRNAVDSNNFDGSSDDGVRPVITLGL